MAVVALSVSCGGLGRGLLAYVLPDAVRLHKADLGDLQSRCPVGGEDVNQNAVLAAVPINGLLWHLFTVRSIASQLGVMPALAIPTLHTEWGLEELSRLIHVVSRE